MPSRRPRIDPGDTEEVAHRPVILSVPHAPELRRRRDPGNAGNGAAADASATASGTSGTDGAAATDDATATADTRATHGTGGAGGALPASASATTARPK